MQMNQRYTRLQYYFELAKACSRRSTCLRRRVGAVIVDSYGTIVSTGYNGAPAGIEDCHMRGECWRDEHDIPHGEHYEKCHSVHAEANALLQAGKAARGCEMYIYSETADGVVTNYPCIMCTRMLINSGILAVYVALPDGTCDIIEPVDYYEQLSEQLMAYD